MRVVRGGLGVLIDTREKSTSGKKELLLWRLAETRVSINSSSALGALELVWPIA